MCSHSSRTTFSSFCISKAKAEMLTAAAGLREEEEEEEVG